MGGSSSQKSTTNSQTQPWAPAQGTLTGILGGLSTVNPQLNPTQSAAIAGLESNAGFLGNFAPGATGIANSLMSGGGATATAPMINDAYAQYQKALAPFTNPASLNPYNTPGFSDALAANGADITNQVNGMFAGAGRDLSGSNVQTLSRGLAQGQGQLIANQYNQNAANALNAAGAAYGAGNTTGGILGGLNQQALANQQAGLGVAKTAQGFSNDAFNQMLSAEAQRSGIPLSILQQIAGIATPIAGLGSQSNGTSDTESQMSGAQQFATIAGGLGNLLPRSSRS
jgi:hypothetical protein